MKRRRVTFGVIGSYLGLLAIIVGLLWRHNALSAVALRSKGDALAAKQRLVAHKSREVALSSKAVHVDTPPPPPAVANQ